jgi:hypothetical protein
MRKAWEWRQAAQWWQSIKPDERRRWIKLANSPRPEQAWDAYCRAEAARGVIRYRNG